MSFCHSSWSADLQYIPRNMHTVTALLCFVVVIHWLIFPYSSGLLHWHCGNLTIAPVPAKQPWWIWIKTLCEFIMNDCITTTKQITKKTCAYFLGYTVVRPRWTIKINCRPWRAIVVRQSPGIFRESHLWCFGTRTARPTLPSVWHVHFQSCDNRVPTLSPNFFSMRIPWDFPDVFSNFPEGT